MNNKKPIIFMVLIAIVGITVGGTLAYFSTRETFTNNFDAATYQIESVEDFVSPDNWIPGDTTPKTVSVTNHGSTPAAVRVKLTPSWVDANGDPLSLIDGNNNEAAIINFSYDSDYKWVKEGDWYYYIRPIDTDESTTSLIESVTFNSDVEADSNVVCNNVNGVNTCTATLSGYSGGTYTLEVEIQTAQYDHYQDVWTTTVSIDEPTPINGRLMENYNTSKTFGKNLSRDLFESVITLDVINIPNNAIDNWDCSEQQNESVICWYTDNDNNGKYELFIGQEGGVIANPNTSYAFAYFKNAEFIKLLNVDATQVEYMYDTFSYDGYNVTSLVFDASDWDVSNVPSLGRLFTEFAKHTKNIDVKIHNWELSETATATEMFAWIGYDAEKIKFDVTGWDFSHVKSMKRVFYDFAQYCRGSVCPTVELIMDGWNTSGVENMEEAFSYAFYFVKDIDLDLTGWDVSSVTNMNQMFNDFANTGKGKVRIDFTGWDTSHVTNMNCMFQLAATYVGEYDYAGSKVTLVGLNNWDVSNVTNMSSMFGSFGKYAETVEIGDLSGWNTSKVTTMSSMFSQVGYMAHSKVDIGSLNVYATNLNYFVNWASSINGVFKIYSNPNNYSYAFQGAATLSSAEIYIDYASTTTNIDNIVATKSNNSNVFKGLQLD